MAGLLAKLLRPKTDGEVNVNERVPPQTPGDALPFSKLGDLTSPASNYDPNGIPGGAAEQVEPPPRDDAEFQQRVKRNEGFLSSPEVQAGLLQFAISIMQPGANFGGAMGQGLAASGRVRTIADDKVKKDREALLDQRRLAVEEGTLSLNEKKLNAEIGAAGNRKYSRMVSGDTPMGLELGILKGQSARVEFEENSRGDIINASIEANPISGKGEGQSDTKVSQLLDEADAAEKAGDMERATLLRAAADREALGDLKPDAPTKVTQLLQEADAAEAAGDTERAALLRKSAEREGTGVSFQGTLDPGTRIGIGKDGEEVIEVIPNSKLDVEQQAEKAAEGGKRITEIKTAINVKRATDRALNQITNALMPDITLTGFGSYLEYVRGTGARDLAETLDTVKSNLGFIKLQDIRDASKTGGALGPVSDFENKLMQATVANVQNAQNAKQLVENLRYVQIMFTDVELEGRLSDIGRRVESGEINEAQGVMEASEYIDNQVKNINQAKTDAEKDLNKPPVSINPPANAPPDLKDVWYNLDEAEQAEAIELLKYRNKGTR